MYNVVPVVLPHIYVLRAKEVIEFPGLKLTVNAIAKQVI